jgi:hypothetical protein
MFWPPPRILRIQTEKGIYRVTLKKDSQLERNQRGEYKEKKAGAYILIGGRGKDCLQIRMPDEGNIGYLLWLESGLNCSINGKETKGDNLMHMVNLGITIVKEGNPNIDFLELLDNAKISCTLPDGSKHDVNLTDHDLAFYQQSYYEKRYSAVLLNKEEQEKYKKSKAFFKDPMKKPPKFHVTNLDLSRELTPLYDEAATWEDFFNKIKEVYGGRKCEVIHPWIQSALQLIMSKLYSGQIWTIDISKIPKIQYKASLIQGGARKFTRKQAKRTESPILIQKMDWRTFLEGMPKGKKIQNNFVDISILQN